MRNNTFFIVSREHDENKWKSVSNRDKWGWEFVDNIEIFDYQQALKMRLEYQAAMPHHVVRIRAIPIEVGLYSLSDINSMCPMDQQRISK